MPFQSERQRKFMHKRHPEIAERWEREAKRSKKSAVRPKKAGKKKGS